MNGEFSLKEKKYIYKKNFTKSFYDSNTLFNDQLDSNDFYFQDINDNSKIDKKPFHKKAKSYHHNVSEATILFDENYEGKYYFIIFLKNLFLKLKMKVEISEVQYLTFPLM